MLLAGFAAGLIAMYKLMGDKIEINIKKIKTKRGESKIPINVETSKMDNKQARKARRLDKKK